VNLGPVLVTGLLAGGVSCAVVQGGLLTGLVTRQRAVTAAASRRSGDRPGTIRAFEPSTGRACAAPTLGSWRRRLADDLAPVGSFLTGKLVSQTMLGALLGASGLAVQMSGRVTAWAQIGAGLLVATFGLAHLGAPGFRVITVTVPASWTRWVRGRARSASAKGCVRAFVIPAMNWQWTLPADGDTAIDLGVLQPGRLHFTCAMGRHSGRLTIT
jgi:hypothetical protein